MIRVDHVSARRSMWLVCGLLDCVPMGVTCGARLKCYLGILTQKNNFIHMRLGETRTRN